MYPDAHVYIHRAEQAARARAHERSADHPAPTPRTLPDLIRSLARRWHAPGGSALDGRRLALRR